MSAPSDALPEGPALSTELFAKLRKSLTAYGIRDFAVYVLDQGEVRLSFSSGAPTSAQAGGDASHEPVDASSLRSLLTAGGTEPILLRDAQAGSSFEGLPGVRTLLRLTVAGSTVGAILVYGHEVQAEYRNELSYLAALFGRTLTQHRSSEALRRDHQRASSRLAELQDGLDILLEKDREQILDTIVRRALVITSARHGSIWLQETGDEAPAHRHGDGDLDSDPEARRVVQRCYETGRACLLNSLSGELTEEFDVETIHIAAAAALPMRTRTNVIGCIVIQDGTVSLDVIETLEATALVGATAIENHENALRMLEQQRLEEQMELAAQIQRRLLPSRSVDLPGGSMAHYNLCCEQAGGDYLDAIETGEPRSWYLAVGDVSGHGLGAAMLMLGVRARLRTLIEAYPLWTPDRILTKLNADIAGECAEEEFVTLFLGRLDLRIGIMHYASAGHEPPLVFSRGHPRWAELPSTGLPLGVLPDSTYEAGTHYLDAGDRVLLLTDGATEAQGPGGSMGVEPLQRTVEENSERDADALLNELLATTRMHCAGTAFVDDVTYLVACVDDVVIRLSERAPQLVGEELAGAVHPTTTSAKDTQLGLFMAALGPHLPADELSLFMMAAEEAFANVVTHGNGNDSGKVMRSTLRWDGRTVQVVITHRGRAFAPRAHVVTHVDEAALYREDGRGLLIIASIMDEVTFWDEGRSVCMTKHIM